MHTWMLPCSKDVTFYILTEDCFHLDVTKTGSFLVSESVCSRYPSFGISLIKWETAWPATQAEELSFKFAALLALYLLRSIIDYFCLVSYGFIQLFWRIPEVSNPSQKDESRLMNRQIVDSTVLLLTGIWEPFPGYGNSNNSYCYTCWK